MRLYFPHVLRVGVVVFLVLSSSVVLYITAQNTLMIQNLADLALESTALSLSSSAEMELRAHPGRSSEHVRQLFSDRVVAYALIVSKDGEILFHTNPGLVGSALEEKGIEHRLEAGRASGRRIQLKTGLPAFEFNYILHRPDGRSELLRLVLHTSPADRILAGTNRLWWTVSLLLVLLWIIGLLLERMFSRQARLAEELEKKGKMALIGQMTAVLAHEIRNALGGIKGYTQWVVEKMEPMDPKKNGLSFALQGAERIETLVNDLLQFSREETYTLAEGLLEPLVQEVIALDVPHWGGRIQLEVEKGTMVKGDRDKIKRVLANGLQNALQAMGEEGRLRIVGRPDGRWVEIRIEDTGPGISPESQPKLFTPFYTTKASGTGLGLAYSKKVIEGMGGTITLRNLIEGPGASLILRLPRAEGH